MLRRPYRPTCSPGFAPATSRDANPLEQIVTHPTHFLSHVTWDFTQTFDDHSTCPTSSHPPDSSPLIVDINYRRDAVGVLHCDTVESTRSTRTTSAAAALLHDERKRLTISSTREPGTTTPVRAGHQLGADDQLTSWVLHKLNDPVICDGFFTNLRQAVDELSPHERFYIPTLAKLGALLFDLPLALDEVDATGNGNADNGMGLAVELNHTDLLIILAFLGTALLVRFSQSNNSADLEESVTWGEELRR